MVEAVLDHAHPDGGIFPPFLLETIAREPVLWARLKTLTLIVYGGAPLSVDVGEELAKSTALWSGFGTTEGGGIPTLEVAAEDWQYIRFHPAVGATFEEQAGLGLHEMVYQKTKASNQAHGYFFGHFQIWKPTGARISSRPILLRQVCTSMQAVQTILLF